MQSQLSREGFRSISSAIDRSATPSSTYIFEIKDILAKIAENYLSVRGSLIARSNERSFHDVKMLEQQYRQVERLLMEAQQRVISCERNSNQEELPAARNSLLFTQQQILLLDNTARLNRSLREQQRKIETSLWDWFDYFISIVAESFDSPSRHVDILAALNLGMRKFRKLQGSGLLRDLNVLNEVFKSSETAFSQILPGDLADSLGACKELSILRATEEFISGWLSVLHDGVQEKQLFANEPTSA